MTKIKQVLVNTLRFMYFCSQILIRRQLNNPIHKNRSGTLGVLGNGPSLSNFIPTLLENKSQDYVVMNLFAFDDVFFTLKPKYYCLADPIVTKQSHLEKKIRLLFSTLSKVDWDMNMYVPKSLYSDFLKFSQLQNDNIKICYVNDLSYSGYNGCRNFFYKKGLAIPPVQTVAIMAIYIGIQKGYNNINLYGLDHDNIKTLSINLDNQLCCIDTHFYKDKDGVTLKPILKPDGKVWKISDFLEAITNMFKSHDLLADYSKYMNVKIINFAPNSMIDSYERHK